MRAITTLSALSVAMAMPAPAAEPSPLLMPIARRNIELTRADGSANIPAILRQFNHTLIKYKANPLPYYPAIAEELEALSLITKRQQAVAPLTDQIEQGVDELYYGNTVVGASDGQPQTFTVDFDTGSADLFVPGPSCGSSQGCVGSTKYDQHGKNLQKTTTDTYGSGQVSGQDYSDDVAVAGLRVTNQTLISLTNAAGFSGSDSEGLMGLGFSTIAQTGAPTYVENLISQKVISTQEFAFYLGRAASGTTAASELALGGRNPKKFSGTPTQVAVTTPGYWQVALDNVVVNGKSAGASTAGQAAIDTGTTLIIAPTVALEAIANAIPGAAVLPQLSGESLLIYPCSTSNKYVPSITFAGKSFAINPVDFNLGTVSLGLNLGSGLLSDLIDSLLGGGSSSSSQYCAAAIMGADLMPTENLYVVGDTFLKNWYSIFNYVNAGGKPSVSFAKAVGNQ